MTLEMCSSLCSLGGFPYMGAQNGKECYCGWRYGKHGLAAAGACSSACWGNALQECGAIFVNPVYELRYTYSDLFKASSRSSMSAPSNFAAYRRVGAAEVVECLLLCDSACQAVIFSPSQRQCSLMKFALVPTELSGVEGDIFTRY